MVQCKTTLTVVTAFRNWDTFGKSCGILGLMDRTNASLCFQKVQRRLDYCYCWLHIVKVYLGNFSQCRTRLCHWWLGHADIIASSSWRSTLAARMVFETDLLSCWSGSVSIRGVAPTYLSQRYLRLIAYAICNDWKELCWFRVPGLQLDSEVSPLTDQPLGRYASALRSPDLSQNAFNPALKAYVICCQPPGATEAFYRSTQLCYC